MDDSVRMKKAFGERLRLLRAKKKNLSQSQCADDLNVEKSKYNKWENGIACPDALTIRALPEFFGTSADYLIGKVDMMDSANVDISIVTGLSELAIERIRQMNALGFGGMLDSILSGVQLTSALSQMSHLQSPAFSEGVYAIVQQADFKSISEGGKGSAALVDASVIERIYTTRAKEELSKMIDEMAVALRNSKD